MSQTECPVRDFSPVTRGVPPLVSPVRVRHGAWIGDRAEREARELSARELRREYDARTAWITAVNTVEW